MPINPATFDFSRYGLSAPTPRVMLAPPPRVIRTPPMSVGFPFPTPMQLPTTAMPISSTGMDFLPEAPPPVYLGSPYGSYGIARRFPDGGYSRTPLEDIGGPIRGGETREERRERLGGELFPTGRQPMARTADTRTVEPDGKATQMLTYRDQWGNPLFDVAVDPKSRVGAMLQQQKLATLRVGPEREQELQAGRARAELAREQMFFSPALRRKRITGLVRAGADPAAAAGIVESQRRELTRRRELLEQTLLSGPQRKAEMELLRMQEAKMKLGLEQEVRGIAYQNSELQRLDALQEAGITVPPEELSAAKKEFQGNVKSEMQRIIPGVERRGKAVVPGVEVMGGKAAREDPERTTKRKEETTAKKAKETAKTQYKTKLEEDRERLADYRLTPTVTSTSLTIAVERLGETITNKDIEYLNRVAFRMQMAGQGMIPDMFKGGEKERLRKVREYAIKQHFRHKNVEFLRSLPERMGIGF